MPLSPEEGRLAVTFAREALECHLNGKKMPTKDLDSGQFSEARGVFVTLNTAARAENNLRGCIGFPYPVKRLGDAIREAAVAAATEDPRFPPVGKEELGSITVEVSILTPPRDLDVPRRELPSHVRIGQDGLMVSRSYASGLLLPQVATEFGMDQIDFLSQTCLKAGLPPDAWLDPATRVQVFQAEIFAEKSPRGEVVRLTGEEP
ncbi:MAG: TIGR00296 family protein [Nitrososphaerales archaeon]